MDLIELNFDAELQGSRGALPPFLGATLRGAFGYLLKQTVCQVSHGNCDRCVLQSVCPYPSIFEGLPPPNRSTLRKYPRIPQPFVLVVPQPVRHASADQPLRWGIRLFGPAVRYWPYVVHAFQTIGESGLGRERIRYRLCAVHDQLGHATIWDATEDEWHQPAIKSLDNRAPDLQGASRLRWEFVTPLSLVADGSCRLDDLHPLDLILAGRRRWKTLWDFYGDHSRQADATEILDPRIEADEFRTVQLTLTPWSIDRYSGRQQRKVPLRGVMGHIVIEGPWERAGVWLNHIPKVHLGKATSFGLGQVRWQPE